MDAKSTAGELQPLVDAVCADAASPEDLQTLSTLLDQSEAARQFYLQYCRMHVELYFCCGEQRLNEAVLDDIRSEAAVPPPSHFAFLGNAIHDTVGYISSGWPVAYLVATVIFGLGLVIGSLVHVSQPAQVARQSSVPSPPVVEPKTAFVGRITGMVDCQFDQRSEISDPKTQDPRPKTVVSLGDKFTLVSGLLEITYDTGAKVILQGPVTYEVESVAGGYLSVGKLLGKVTGKSAKGFRIETPTAEVVDLGTEFGVDVAKDGTSEIHVLKGLVQTQFRHSSGQVSQPVQLREGEGRRYPCRSGQDTQPSNLVTVIPLDRAKFQGMHIRRTDDRRERWLAYSRQLRKDPALVAYYSFESAGESNATLPNLSSAGKALDGQVEGAEWVYGRFPGKFALYFHGPNSSDRVVLPEQERFKFTGPFSVAVWFRAEKFAGRYQALVAKGDTSWRLQQDLTSNHLCFDTSRGHDEAPYVVDRTTGRSNVADGRWRLAVAVYEPAGKAAHKRLYLDGRLEAEGDAPLPLRQNNAAVWLGANGMAPQCEFEGLIDEVAVMSRGLSADEVAAMFDGGNPAGPSKGGTINKRPNGIPEKPLNERR